MSDPARLYLITPVLADADAFRPRLELALSVPVDCVLLRFASGVTRDARTDLVRLTQSKGAAALLTGDARDAVRLGADGIHVPATGTAVSDALETLKPDRIVGAGAIGSRDEAMDVGEAETDYLMFGEPRPDGYVPPLLTTLDWTRWWAEIFNVPCVAYSDTFDDVWPLVEAGAEFIALGDCVWADVRGPDVALRGLAGVLSRKAFA